MNIYKRKKFISQFKIDYFSLAIVECPNIKKPFLVEYNEKNSLFKAYFNKSDCDKCRYRKKCIKEDFNDIYYEVLIKNNNSKEGCNIKTQIKARPINENEVIYKEKLLTEGRELKRKGKYEEAKDKYIQAIKIDCKYPIAYYNLGKILYILGDFEASARSYKTAFELGIDPIGSHYQYNLLIHLGHSLLDPNLKNDKFKSVISFYERGINPYLIKKYANNVDKFSEMFKNQQTKELLDEFENKCIEASKKYLGVIGD